MVRGPIAFPRAHLLREGCFVKHPTCHGFDVGGAKTTREIVFFTGVVRLVVSGVRGGGCGTVVDLKRILLVLVKSESVCVVIDDDLKNALLSVVHFHLSLSLSFNYGDSQGAILDKLVAPIGATCNYSLNVGVFARLILATLEGACARLLIARPTNWKCARGMEFDGMPFSGGGLPADGGSYVAVVPHAEVFGNVAKAIVPLKVEMRLSAKEAYGVPENADHYGSFKLSLREAGQGNLVEWRPPLAYSAALDEQTEGRFVALVIGTNEEPATTTTFRARVDSLLAEAAKSTATDDERIALVAQIVAGEYAKKDTSLLVFVLPNDGTALRFDILTLMIMALNPHALVLDIASKPASTRSIVPDALNAALDATKRRGATAPQTDYGKLAEHIRRTRKANLGAVSCTANCARRHEVIRVTMLLEASLSQGADVHVALPDLDISQMHDGPEVLAPEISKLLAYWHHKMHHRHTKQKSELRLSRVDVRSLTVMEDLAEYLEYIVERSSPARDLAFENAASFTAGMTVEEMVAAIEEGGSRAVSTEGAIPVVCAMCRGTEHRPCVTCTLTALTALGRIDPCFLAACKKGKPQFAVQMLTDASVAARDAAIDAVDARKYDADYANVRSSLSCVLSNGALPKNSAFAGRLPALTSHMDAFLAKKGIPDALTAAYFRR
jgi:hypothetical protein